jgi:hypothetical protein
MLKEMRSWDYLHVFFIISITHELNYSRLKIHSEMKFDKVTRKN